MGALQDQQNMRRSVEKPSKGYSLGHSLSNDEAQNNLSGRDTSFKPTLQDGVSCPNGDSLTIKSSGFHPPPSDKSPLKIRLNPKILTAMKTLKVIQIKSELWTTDEINQARQRILVLEAELEKPNKAAAELLQELSKEKLRSSDLESRIEGLELALELERKKVDEKDITDLDASDGYGGMLEVARKER
ncbi:hypothetical protein BYT27DRAFT_7241135 [Phlegmacium glaucopus]|nr:hypothetical protein BYT27DRAFT_7241135 [Phlegmacium glaucopus]